MGKSGIIIEIGTGYIKGVLFSSFLGREKVERVESVPVETGKTSSAVEKLLSGFPSGAAITLQLPGHLFMARNVSLPFTDSKKIRKALPFHMDGLLPFHVDELFFDSVSSVASGRGNSIIAIAIHRKTVAGYLSYFPEGKKPSRVIPDFVSMMSLATGVRKDGGICGILEINEECASMVFLSGDRPALVRSLQTGSGHPPAEDTIMSTIKSIQSGGQRLERLYVTGTQAQHAMAILEGKAPVVPLPPPEVKWIAPGDWPSWASLIGGIKAGADYPAFNILGLDAEGERLEKLIKASSIGAAILLSLGTADIYIRYKTAYNRYSTLKSESGRTFISAMPDVKRVVKEDAQIRDALNREKSAMESLIGKPAQSYISVLNGIENSISRHPGIKVREAVFDKESLVISGDGNGIDANGIKKVFSEMEGNRGVQIEEIVQGIEPNSCRFRIKIDIAKTEKQAGG